MYKKELKDKRTYKALFLLNLLSYKPYSKNEIIYEFAKNKVNISRTSIANYLEKLKAYNIPIITKEKNGIEIYSLDKKQLCLDITAHEATIAQDVKKLLILQKDLDFIRIAMRLFYKFALLVPEVETRAKLADFGYYSTIDWRLVEELKQHCRDKNVIEIDYILPDGGSKCVNFHADELLIGSWSEKIYLKGVFEHATVFSRLPIDRIYMVRRIVSELERFDLEMEVLTYKIDAQAAKEMHCDMCEAITKYEGDYAYVKRPIDDNLQVIQKLLYFCPNLYYISDKDIKKRVEDKLYVLKDMYDARLC